MICVICMGTIYIVNVCLCYGDVEDLVSAASTGVLEVQHDCQVIRTCRHARTHARTHPTGCYVNQSK